MVRIYVGASNGYIWREEWATRLLFYTTQNDMGEEYNNKITRSRPYRHKLPEAVRYSVAAHPIREE